jgi:hypothetical protein
MKSNLLKCVLFTILAISLTLCTKTSDSNSIEGKIKVYVCSRGCYQYLISIPSASNDTLFYPVNLSDEYKNTNMDGVKINITFDVLSSTTQIFYPSPTDAPLPLFQVKNINITRIKNSN